MSELIAITNPEIDSALSLVNALRIRVSNRKELSQIIKEQDLDTLTKGLIALQEQKQ